MSSVQLDRQVSTVSAPCAQMDGNRTNRRHHVSRVQLGTLVANEPAKRVDQVNVLRMTRQHAPHARFKPTGRQAQTAFCAALGLSPIWAGLAVSSVASGSTLWMAGNAKCAHLASSQLLSATVVFSV